MELWLKEVAGSDALRKWSSHDPQKWEEFKRKYEAELKKKQELLRSIDHNSQNMRAPSLHLTSRAFTA
jgi:uncharacterized protein YeaO (DUF488 family)